MDLWACVRPGMMVVDVGANTGSYTQQFLDKGAKVWAIEPDPRCQRPLLERLPRAQVLELAVGDQDTWMTLHRSAEAPHNSLYPANVLHPGSVPALDVPITTLDILQVTGLLPPKVDLIKVDVQGAEVSVLKGAADLCRTQQPLWYVEFWPQGLREAGTSADELCDLFAAYGYSAHAASWDQVREDMTRTTGHSSQDYLLYVEGLHAVS